MKVAQNRAVQRHVTEGPNLLLANAQASMLANLNPLPAIGAIAFRIGVALFGRRRAEDFCRRRGSGRNEAHDDEMSQFHPHSLAQIAHESLLHDLWSVITGKELGGP